MRQMRPVEVWMRQVRPVRQMWTLGQVWAARAAHCPRSGDRWRLRREIGRDALQRLSLEGPLQGLVGGRIHLHRHGQRRLCGDTRLSGPFTPMSFALFTGALALLFGALPGACLLVQLQTAATLSRLREPALQ